MNAFPGKDNDGNHFGGNNDCFAINHYDLDAFMYYEDGDRDPLPIVDQKYTVDGKEYTVCRAGNSKSSKH